MWPNAWVAAVAFAWAMPLLAGVAVVAWLGALLPAAHLESLRAGLPALFFAAYLAEDAERCGPPAGRTCAALLPASCANLKGVALIRTPGSSHLRQLCGGNEEP